VMRCLQLHRHVRHAQCYGLRNWSRNPDVASWPHHSLVHYDEPFLVLFLFVISYDTKMPVVVLAIVNQFYTTRVDRSSWYSKCRSILDVTLLASIGCRSLLVKK
jgi:hypothetical protein